MMSFGFGVADTIVPTQLAWTSFRTLKRLAALIMSYARSHELTHSPATTAARIGEAKLASQKQR